MDLNQLVADVEDVSDPSSIDKILGCAEQIQEDDDNFMHLLTEKLRNAVVYWEQPWYQKDNILGHRHNTLDENAYRTDAISKEEHDIIARNWRKLIKRYGIPDNIISFARWRSLGKTKNPGQSVEEQVRRFITSYLARGLERDTHQIYRHVKSYYGGYRRGTFSATEEKIIEICFHHIPATAGKILSTVLGREPRGVNKRLLYLRKEKPKRKRSKWNLNLAAQFLQHLLKYSGFEVDELKNRKIEKWIWHKLEEDMDQNDYNLQHFWYCYLHVQLFVKCDVKLRELKKKILKKLRMKARENVYKVWSDIRWKDITEDFPDGLTPRFLYKITRDVIMTFKGYVTAPLEDVVEYGLEKIKKMKRKSKYRNKRLKTLRMNKKGQLERIDYK